MILAFNIGTDAIALIKAQAPEQLPHVVINGEYIL